MCRRAHKEGESCQIVSIKIYLWRVGEFYLSWGKPRFTDQALLSLSPPPLHLFNLLVFFSYPQGVFLPCSSCCFLSPVPLPSTALLAALSPSCPPLLIYSLLSVALPTNPSYCLFTLSTPTLLLFCLAPTLFCLSSSLTACYFFFAFPLDLLLTDMGKVGCNWQVLVESTSSAKAAPSASCQGIYSLT